MILWFYLDLICLNPCCMQHGVNMGSLNLPKNPSQMVDSNNKPMDSWSWTNHVMTETHPCQCQVSFIIAHPAFWQPWGSSQPVSVSTRPAMIPAACRSKATPSDTQWQAKANEAERLWVDLYTNLSNQRGYSTYKTIQGAVPSEIITANVATVRCAMHFFTPGRATRGALNCQFFQAISVLFRNTYISEKACMGQRRVAANFSVLHQVDSQLWSLAAWWMTTSPSGLDETHLVDLALLFWCHTQLDALILLGDIHWLWGLLVNTVVNGPWPGVWEGLWSNSFYFLIARFIPWF